MRISDWRSDVCSSDLGIFRRHPDVLHRIGSRQIEERAELQKELLIRAASWVKPGGVLVYATCSLERADGEEQIEPLLSARGPFDMDNIDPVVLPADVAPAAQGWLRTFPSLLAATDRLHGFLLQCMRRQYPSSKASASPV